MCVTIDELCRAVLRLGYTNLGSAHETRKPGGARWLFIIHSDRDQNRKSGLRFSRRGERLEGEDLVFRVVQLNSMLLRSILR